jgi:SAM-dependent methyltransferase
MRLNIACGANVFPGWVNLDRTDIEAEYLSHLRSAPSFEGWPEHQRKLGLAVKEGLVEFRQKDLREGFPEYADNSVDAIYCGQMIEHLHRFTEAPKFLRECHRMLKPGGWIRLTTPDLGLILYEYENGNLDAFASEQPAFFARLSGHDQLSCLLFGASGDGCTRENYEGHFHCYSTFSLQLLLEECRFGSLETRPPEREGVIDCGMSHSMAIEAVKP